MFSSCHGHVRADSRAIYLRARGGAAFDDLITWLRICSFHSAWSSLGCPAERSGIKPGTASSGFFTWNCLDTYFFGSCNVWTGAIEGSRAVRAGAQRGTRVVAYPSSDTGFWRMLSSSVSCVAFLRVRRHSPKHAAAACGGRPATAWSFRFTFLVRFGLSVFILLKNFAYHVLSVVWAPFLSL